MEEISTEIIFTDKQEISAVEIFIGGCKFVLTDIEEEQPLNYYISAHQLRQYLNESKPKEGATATLTPHLTITNLPKNGKK